jgi:serine phosphatase RsbU (regulator of sigma subunit)
LRSPKTAELYDVAIKAQQRREIFDSINVNGRKYFALTADVDTAWSVVLLFSEEQATQAIRSTGQVQAIVGGLTLLLVLLFVAIRSRRISRPISEAGRALQKIGVGDFDVHLSVPSDASNDDEVTGLLRNVQVSSDRLRAYLTEVTSFAVTQKQLDTAKSIQRDFLLQALPESSEYQASAVSRPALEIGADWYDMVDAGNHVVFVVADVCDKGVPSALYMSVFRSLIRSKILDHLSDLSSTANASDVIRDAIARTNDYMAANQNSSMMFATVLIAAVHKETGVMSYLCAGHETPYILRSGEIVPLDHVSGPAIGLFGGADYSVSTFELQSGDRLVLYSDGLVDARSPADEGFGHEKLEALLRAVRPCTSSQLLDIIVSAVDDHMDGADQFDDLTIMVFEWKGS